MKSRWMGMLKDLFRSKEQRELALRKKRRSDGARRAAQTRLLNKQRAAENPMGGIENAKRKLATAQWNEAGLGNAVHGLDVGQKDVSEVPQDIAADPFSPWEVADGFDDPDHDDDAVQRG